MRHIYVTNISACFLQQTQQCEKEQGDSNVATTLMDRVFPPDDQQRLIGESVRVRVQVSLDVCFNL